MPQDAFHIRRSVKELNTLLTKGKVNKISQIDKDELTLIIYTGKTTLKLVLSTNATFARVCLTQKEKEPAPIAPNFCMLMRKHLQGAEILSVKQHDFERIIEIEFLATSDFSSSKRTLIAEIMGKYSNLILIQENGIILGALKTTAIDNTSHRILLPGAKYIYPEPQNKISPFSIHEIEEREKEYFSLRERTIDNEATFLFENVMGLALTTATEIAKRRKDTPLSIFTSDFCENEPCAPCVIEQENHPVDFCAFKTFNSISAPSLLKAEDIYYTYREEKKHFNEEKTRLESALKSLTKKVQKELRDIEERLLSASNSEENRLKGELITANLYRINKGETSFTTENWYTSPPEEITISLDKNLSPNENAQRYFKLYAKQKRTKDALIPRLKKETAEKEYTESILLSLLKSERLEDLKEIREELIGLGLIRASQKEKIGSKKKESPTPFREYEFEGYKILCGRNNLQNDRLIRSVDGEDIWLHTQKYHSSHVVIITNGRKAIDEVIQFAAEICAYYSDGNGKIAVDYCKKKRVKKPPKSAAGFVIYSDYKTILVEPNAHK